MYMCSSYVQASSLTLNINVFTIAIHIRSHCDLTCITTSIRQSKRTERQGIRTIANLCLSSAIILSPLVGDDRIGASNARHTTHKGTALPSNYGTSTVIDVY